MGSLNKALLIGVITDKEIDLRSTKSGKMVCDFTLAVRGMGESCYFASIIAWDKKAEYLKQYAKKGTMLYVEGTLIQQKWQTKTGEERTKTAITATNIQFLERKPREEGAADVQEERRGVDPEYAPPMRSYETAPSNHGDSYPQYAGANVDWQEDDIPF
jgi:single-strand DNA-binding protein